MIRSFGFTLMTLCLASMFSTHGYGAEKPTYTDRMNAGTEEVEYVLESISRNGREVTLTLSATLTKGPERREILFFSANMVDAEGNEYKARLNTNGSRSRPEQVTVRAGIKTKINLRFPLDPKVSKLQVLEVTMSFVERVAIRFSDLEIPNK